MVYKVGEKIELPPLGVEHIKGLREDVRTAKTLMRHGAKMLDETWEEFWEDVEAAIGLDLGPYRVELPDGAEDFVVVVGIPKPEPGAPFDEPVEPVSADVTVTWAGHQKSVSPFIFGYNGLIAGMKMIRAGGNRWSAYNWVINASNAGSDWLHNSDRWLGGGDALGGAVHEFILKVLDLGAQPLITVPLLGLVAADEDGPVSPDEVAMRFVKSLPFKNTPLSLNPSIEGPVYQDEFISWFKQVHPDVPLHVCLGNEPGLWATTHPLPHPNKATYQEVIDKSQSMAMAIRSIDPEATVYGPVVDGYSGILNLNGALDADGRDFLDVYLKNVDVNVLDVHHYSEARGAGGRVTTAGAQAAEARVQAPRSLWDPDYIEDSWVGEHFGAFRLIPMLREKVATNRPGTKISISEYSFGGGDHISGAIAQADALGIFAREGVHAACYWPLRGQGHEYVHAAFRLFEGFGDTIRGTTLSDDAMTSVYWGTDCAVVINKDTVPRTLGGVGDQTAEVHQVTGAGPEIVNLGPRSVEPFVMPPMSVSRLDW